MAAAETVDAETVDADPATEQSFRDHAWNGDVEKMKKMLDAVNVDAKCPFVSDRGAGVRGEYECRDQMKPIMAN